VGPGGSPATRRSASVQPMPGEVRARMALCRALHTPIALQSLVQRRVAADLRAVADRQLGEPWARHRCQPDPRHRAANRLASR
jgi:hypothetical protein